MGWGEPDVHRAGKERIAESRATALTSGLYSCGIRSAIWRQVAKADHQAGADGAPESVTGRGGPGDPWVEPAVA